MKQINSEIIIENNDYVDYIKSFNYKINYKKFETIIYNIVSMMVFKKFSYNKKRKDIDNYNYKLEITNNIINKYNYIYDKEFNDNYVRIEQNNHILFGKNNSNILNKWIPCLITYLIKLFQKHNIKKFEIINTDLTSFDIVNFEITDSLLLNYLFNSMQYVSKTLLIDIIYTILKKSLNRTIVKNDFLLDDDII